MFLTWYVMFLICISYRDLLSFVIDDTVSFLHHNEGHCKDNDNNLQCKLNLVSHPCPPDVMSHLVNQDCTIDCCTDNSCVARHFGGVYTNAVGNTVLPPISTTTVATTPAPTTTTTTPATTTVTTLATTVAPYNVYAHLQQECRVQDRFCFRHVCSHCPYFG